MALCFIAVVNNPDAPISYKVLRSMSLRGAKSEAKKKYLIPGGMAAIWDGHPQYQPDAKCVGSTERAD